MFAENLTKVAKQNLFYNAQVKTLHYTNFMKKSSANVRLLAVIVTERLKLKLHHFVANMIDCPLAQPSDKCIQQKFRNPISSSNLAKNGKPTQS